MITAQIFAIDKPRTVTGESVCIEDAPPRTRFLISHRRPEEFCIFSIDTGCYVATGRTAEVAILNADLNFRIRAKKPRYAEWWNVNCRLFQAYLLYVWRAHEAKEICSNWRHPQHDIPHFFDVKGE